MIVKIFGPVKGFPGVFYNLTKIERGKAELMKSANFGALQAYSQVGVKDFEDYFLQLAALNKRTNYPMLHGTISAAGRSASKEELAATAERWLELMGYTEQPYLIVFHKDTANNHVHVVTSRIDKNGKKISSAFEHNRAISALNQAIGLDEHLTAKKDLRDALKYKFATQAQFAMILEARGYRLHENALIKFGHRLLDIPEAAIKFQPAPKLRAAQLKAIMEKYRHHYSAALIPATITLPSGYERPLHKFRSDLGDYLRVKHGLELVFHASGDKPAYGYSVIDHAKKNVYKGGEIMPLKDLLGPVLAPGTEAIKSAALEESPPAVSYENHETADEQEDGQAHQSAAERVFDAPIHISIADDVDDQQIHGMRRRRQKKARTNTR